MTDKYSRSVVNNAVELIRHIIRDLLFSGLTIELWRNLTIGTLTPLNSVFTFHFIYTSPICSLKLLLEPTLLKKFQLLPLYDEIPILKISNNQLGVGPMTYLEFALGKFPFVFIRVYHGIVAFKCNGKKTED